MLDPRHPHHRSWSWAAVAMLCLELVGTAGAHVHAHPPGPIWLGVMLAAAAVLPALLPLQPYLALLASGALTCAYFAGGYEDGPVYLALPTVAYLVAVRHPPRRWVWPAGVAGLLAAAGLA
ncbi:MAG: hypothetical protein J2P15_24030, partial [Micromonosporaceae bacterium]|nr:hypothetical protein [Micromonosporaceae bacterium]